MALRNYSSTAAEATLTAGVNASATTLSVSSTTGFPATPFVLAVDAGAAAQELVLVTNVAGTNLTVTRGYDSTVAASHDTGAVVAHSHAAIDFREANSHVNATSGVHGASGAIVGTTDTQTLTNKTVALGSNTVTGTKAQFNSAMTDADFRTTTDTDLPLGTLGYAQVTANQGAVTTEVDITGLSVAVTVGTSRRIRVSTYGLVTSTTGGDVAEVRIKEGATQLQAAPVFIGSGSGPAVIASVILTPTAGAHTYKAAIARTVGPGTISHLASATTPAYILIEDIGPA